jgi:hypothetical protein
MTGRLRGLTAVVLQLSILTLLFTPNLLWAGEAKSSLPVSAGKAKDSPRVTTDKAKDPEAPNYHRFAFLGAGALGAGGLVFGFIARGQQDRAKSLSSAGEAARTMEDARQSAAAANVLYALAGVTLVYALVLEFLPRPDAEKASLTFHF